MIRKIVLEYHYSSYVLFFEIFPDRRDLFLISYAAVSVIFQPEYLHRSDIPAEEILNSDYIQTRNRIEWIDTQGWKTDICP